jgi:hypothetical protein
MLWNYQPSTVFTMSIFRKLREYSGTTGGAPCRPGSSRKAAANLAREGRVDYLLLESTGIPEPLPAAEPRLGRRTVLTFPLFPPPQKN